MIAAGNDGTKYQGGYLEFPGIRWLRPQAFRQLLSLHGKLLRQQDLIAQHPELLVSAEEMLKRCL